MTAPLGIEQSLPTQTRSSGFSKAARRSSRPPSGSASTKRPFVASQTRPQGGALDESVRGELNITGGAAGVASALRRLG